VNSRQFEEANEEAMRLLLSPKGESRAIGPESGRVVADGIGVYLSPYGSVRFVRSVGGVIVAALQVMDDGRRQVATNAYTAPTHRRAGYATELWKAARRRFPGLQASPDQSKAGAAWVRSLT
jgi:hypothetical protein